MFLPFSISSISFQGDVVRVTRNEATIFTNTVVAHDSGQLYLYFKWEPFVSKWLFIPRMIDSEIANCHCVCCENVNIYDKLYS